MKKVLFMGIAASLLTACSNDEVVPAKNEANAIRFGVTTDRNSRAADVYCNNNKPGSFTVFATHQGKTYISDDLIEFVNETNMNGFRQRE